MKNLMRANGTFCSFHPKQKIVGVCPLCLNERLIVLASKQSISHISSSAKKSSRSHRRKLSDIFVFSSILNFRHRKCADEEDFDREASTSQEDSFISIKFEDNGVASWEKGKVSKVSLEHCNLSWNRFSIKETKSIVEHAKSPAPLGWQKRVGQMFQVIRWTRSKKTNLCRGGRKFDSVKVRVS